MHTGASYWTSLGSNLMSIKKLFLVALSVLSLTKGAEAVTNGSVAISSGTAFYGVDVSSMSNKFVRQNIVISDPNQVSGVAPVSSITGLTVNLASSTANIGTVVISTANGISGSTIAVTNAGGAALIVDGSAVTQPVSGSFFQATQPISGSVTISTGGVTAVLSGAIPSGTNPIGSVTISTGGVTAVLGTGSNAIGSITNTSFAISTGGVTSAQGPPGTLEWAARVSSTNVSQSTVTIQAPNNNTTPIPVSGSFSASTINTSTASTNSVAPISNVVVGGIGVNGNVSPFLLDGSSNIYVTSVNNEKTDVTGTFTNATQTTSVTATNCSGYSNFFVTINGTYATASAVFEGSDDNGTTWYPVQASRDDSPTVETGYTTLTNVTRSWQVNNPGLDSMRIRSTAVASGTANLRISVSAAPSTSGANVSISNVTATPNTTLPTTAVFVHGQGLTGLAQTFLVDNSSDVMVNLIESSFTVLPGPQFLGVDFSTGIRVSISTGGVTAVLSGALPAGTNALGSVTISTGGVTAVLGTGANAIGSITNTSFTISTGAVSAQALLIVSSATTLPAQTNDGARVSQMADNEGRTVTVAGVPSSVLLTSAPITAQAGWAVIVASPATTGFVHMCGCIFINSSASADTITLYPSGGVVNPSIALPLPASDSRGIWPGCDEPFMNTTAGGSQVSMKVTSAVSSISGYCQYYLSNSP